jgi:hypothetical protein
LSLIPGICWEFVTTYYLLVTMSHHDFHASAEAGATAETDYRTERGKPIPSLNHATVQLNLGSELRIRYKSKYRITSDLSLTLDDWPSVPDISVLPPTPMDLRHDITAITEPPLLTHRDHFSDPVADRTDRQGP